MAHYAKLDDNNIVLSVVVIDNHNELLNGVEDEATGIAYCRSFSGHAKWAKTSYNASIRKNYASIGDRYDPELDAFVSPQPFSSWTLDENARWQPPKPRPRDRRPHIWDETTQEWVLVNPQA